MTVLTEILGIFLLVVGMGACVGAAALISTALAVLAAGLFLMFGGVVVIYLANAAELAAERKEQSERLPGIG